MNAPLLILALFLGTATQAALPTWWWCGGLRLELLPALVAFGGLTLPSPRVAVAFAVAVGLAQDAFSAATLGLTALAYGTVAGLLAAWQEHLERDLPWVQLGSGALASAAASLLAILATGLFSFGGVMKLILLALISAVVTPFVFLIGDWVRASVEDSRC